MDDDLVLFAPSVQKKKRVSAVDAVDNNARSSSVTEPPVIPPRTFPELGLDSWLVDALKGVSIERPTSVQAGSIPAVLAGKDIIAAAKTGSGKTGAFALPILHDLARNPHGFFALVLTPTRELAIQIAEQFQIFGKAIRLSVCVAVGGLDMMKQSMELSKKPHIIVATPGRLADLLSGDQFDMRRLKYLVFDEADRLVAPDASFMEHEIPSILRQAGCSSTTQWLFYSATMTSEVSDFYKRHRAESQPFRFDGNSEFGTVESLDQYFMLVPSQVRDAHLLQLLRENLIDKTVIIFVGKCKTAELLLETLRQLKISAVGLHGQMSQKMRLASLAKFKSGSITRLITTDVGSRGLDIPSVEFVVNFDLPADARDYVHRVGRAARAGRKGSSISFVHELDVELLRNIEGHISTKLQPFERAPKENEIIKILNEVSAAKRTAGLLLHDKKFGEKSERNKRKWAAASS